MRIVNKYLENHQSNIIFELPNFIFIDMPKDFNPTENVNLKKQKKI